MKDNPDSGSGLSCPVEDRHPMQTAYELCFRSLQDPDLALAFPCDALGHVDLDGLSERDRSNYLYARAVMGRDLAAPAVQFSLSD